LDITSFYSQSTRGIASNNFHFKSDVPMLQQIYIKSTMKADFQQFNRTTLARYCQDILLQPVLAYKNNRNKNIWGPKPLFLGIFVWEILIC